MARRNRAFYESSSCGPRRSISPPPEALITTGSPMGAQLLIRRLCTIGCFPRPGRGVRSGALPCKIPSAVGVAGGRRYRQNIERQARRRPVIGQDPGRDWFAERLLSDCTSSTAASREIPLVRCCVLASVLRAKRRWLCPATATRLELRRPELCPLRHATPTKICTAGVRLSSQDRRAGVVTFDGRCLGPLPCSTSDSGAPGSTVPASRAS